MSATSRAASPARTGTRWAAAGRYARRRRRRSRLDSRRDCRSGGSTIPIAHLRTGAAVGSVSSGAASALARAVVPPRRGQVSSRGTRGHLGGLGVAAPGQRRQRRPVGGGQRSPAPGACRRHRASKALAIQARTNRTGSEATIAGMKVSRAACRPAQILFRIGHRSLNSPSKPCSSVRVVHHLRLDLVQRLLARGTAVDQHREETRPARTTGSPGPDRQPAEKACRRPNTASARRYRTSPSSREAARSRRCRPWRPRACPGAAAQPGRPARAPARLRGNGDGGQKSHVGAASLVAGWAR